MSDGDKKSVVAEVGGWIWGTIEGGFNEQASISQIIVDALIGMIPVVGDVTAVRDLVAVILRLVENPKKRTEVLEWVTLVLLLFALIPVAGGAIKGVGKLLIAAGVDVGKHEALIKDLIQFLNRVGYGDAVKFLKSLDFEGHTAEIVAKWKDLTKRLDDVFTAILKRAGSLIPASMTARIQAIQKGVKELAELGDKMIPDALKELNKQLRAVQKKIYEGKWNEIGGAWKSMTREEEARLVEEEIRKTIKNPPVPPPFPKDTLKDFHPEPGYPNLTDKAYLDNVTGEPRVIASFSGPIKARFLNPGEKIRRIVDDPAIGAVKNSGAFWALASDFPADGATWRKTNAVLDSWNTEGYFIELVVPKGGLWVWEGKIASQVEDKAAATLGQTLEGGATQLFIDFRGFPPHADAQKIVDALPRQPTGWTDHMGINVPDKKAIAQRLEDGELEPKEFDANGAARTGISLSQSGNNDQQPQQQTGTGP